LLENLSENYPKNTAGGERIQVTVLAVKGNQVRIGTQVPDGVTILREELVERLQAGGQ